MPRTSALDQPGCPPLRALTFDVLGLIKVVVSRGERGLPTVVDRWGDPDSKRCVVAAAVEGCSTNPHLAVGRKNGLVEILNSVSGDSLASVKVSEAGPAGVASEDDLVVSLHAFKPVKPRLCKLFTCTMKGKACIQSIHVDETPSVSSSESSKSWNICSSGKVLFSAVDGSEKYALFGGKGVEINVWDLHECSKIWSTKSPPRNSIGIFAPTWFTAATYLTNDHHKIVTGTKNHQVRLYDISAQRKPVFSFDFRESPIKAVSSGLDGYTIFVGSATGDLASFDIRTGKLVGCFVGKCSGSIRCIARHPELPIIASCGLDSYLRFWDSKTRKPLSAVFLKQQLAHVILDTGFSGEVTSVSNGSREKVVGQVHHDELEEKNVSSKRRLSCAEREKSDRKKRRGTVSCH